MNEINEEFTGMFVEGVVKLLRHCSVIPSVYLFLSANVPGNTKEKRVGGSSG
jgi:hypothetical protein